MKPAKEIRCPVCGYLCLGHGGVGCIDKPFMVKLEEEQEDLPVEVGKLINKHFWKLV
jgi:hypothetical protein